MGEAIVSYRKRAWIFVSIIVFITVVSSFILFAMGYVAEMLKPEWAYVSASIGVGLAVYVGTRVRGEVVSLYEDRIVYRNGNEIEEVLLEDVGEVKKENYFDNHPGEPSFYTRSEYVVYGREGRELMRIDRFAFGREKADDLVGRLKDIQEGERVV